MGPKLSFVFKIALLILPVALIMGLVSWYVDPGLIFKAHTYEAQLADTLLSGKNAVINTNFSDRIFERDLVNKMKYRPGTVILGTSRIMELEQNFFCADTIFNNAVSAGRLEDMIAIYGLYAKKGVFPKRLIINMEPTFFSLSTQPPLWVELSDEYVYMLNLLHCKPAKPIWTIKAGWEFDKISNLWSPEYFKAAIHRFAHNYKLNSQSDKIISSKSAFNEGITRLSDGSMTYNRPVRDQTDAQVLASAITTAGKPLPAISNFSADSGEVQLFEKFIIFLLAKHTKVILTFTPYHPVIYREILNNSNYSEVPKNELFIKSFAAKNGITCIGSYNPAKVNATNRDFLDSFHLRTSSLYRLLAPLSGCQPSTK